MTFIRVQLGCLICALFTLLAICVAPTSAQAAENAEVEQSSPVSIEENEGIVDVDVGVGGVLQPSSSDPQAANGESNMGASSQLQAAEDPADPTDPTDPVDPEPEPPNALPTVAGSQATLADKQTTTETVTTETQDMYRMYNPNSGEHFYTAAIDERDHLVDVGWHYEGVGWTAPVVSDAPVYRLYNPNAGDHHYTLDESEKDYLSDIGWNFEGIGWYSAPSAKGTPVFRQYNPNATAGSHNFTMDTSENTNLVELGWHFETIAWYALTATSEVIEHTTSTITATAPYLTATFAAAADKALETIVSYAKDDTTYFLFPSYAPLNKVMLNAFDAKGEQVRVYISNGPSYKLIDPATYIDLTALGAKTDSMGSLYLSFVTASMEAFFPLVVMKSANIPAVYINSANISSQGRAYVEASPDHSAKAKVAVSVVGADGSVVYDSDDLTNSKKISSIKGRGNSSWGIGEKKPYQISLSTKSSLVDGAGKAKKWILLANGADPTLLGNSIAFDFARELGLDSVISTPVDLYYDGEYRGNYLLVEKIEIGKDRIDIADLEDAYEDANPDIDLESQPTAMAVNRFGLQMQYVTNIVDPENYSGGYLLELDTAYYRSEACWFEVLWPDTGIITHFVVKSPEFASMSAVKFISEAVQEALNNLAAGRTNLTDGSFSFDLDSFAKMYLLGEFFKNLDVFASSTYYYIDAGSTVFTAGPVWDFDACMGRRVDASGSLPSAYSGIFSPVTGMSIFYNGIQSRVREIYASAFSGLAGGVVLGDASAIGLAGALHSIVWYANRIVASSRMDNLVFGVNSFDNQMKPFETWGTNVQYLQNWVYWRTSWFNANYFNVGNNAVTNANRSHDGFDYGLVFDYDYYLEQNPDVAAQYSNPEEVILHFILYGMPQGRMGSRNFDVNAYRSNNPQLNKLFGDNLMAYYYHYCTDGFKAGLVSWA